MVNKLAPLTPSRPPLHGANTGRGRFCWSPLTLLAFISTAALPAFSQQTFPPIPDSAQEHGIGAHPNPLSDQHKCLSAFCCSLKDCRPLAAGVVKVTPNGWSVPLPDGRREVVSFTDKRLRQSSPECSAQEFGQSEWACYNQQDGQWVLRCFYPRLQGF